MVPRKLQKTDNLCGFHANYSAIRLFNFLQKNLNYDRAVHIVSFISNFI